MSGFMVFTRVLHTNLPYYTVLQINRASTAVYSPWMFYFFYNRTPEKGY